MSFEPDAIRAAHPLADAIASRGIEIVTRNGRMVGLCPFHAERTPSFTIFPDGRFHCFGCGASGDVIDFVRQLDGLDFREACERLGGSDAPAEYRPKPRPISKPEPVPPLTRKQLALVRRARHEVYRSKALREWLCRPRGWREETLQDLAVEWFGLGFADRFPSFKGGPSFKRCVLFAYPHGVKVSYHPEGGHPLGKGRQTRWAIGRPSIPWRANLDRFRYARRVVIAEGEPDAVSAYDAGVDAGDRSVVSLPSASTWRSEWAPMFRGKKVVIATDADEAGRKAARKIIESLDGIAAEIRQLEPEGAAA